MFSNWIRLTWIAFVFSLVIPVQGTELDKLEIRVSEGKLSFRYSVDAVSGVLALYHATNLETSRDLWNFVALQPVTSLEGSLQLASLDYSVGDTGFFELRDAHFEPAHSLVWIHPGRFLLGSPDSEQGRYSDEGPQHEVSIPHGYWLSKYEVTQSEFETLASHRQS